MGIAGLRLDKHGRLDIPKDKTKLKFDVGLSWRAPNSALWLSDEKDLFVVGIEPNIDALNSIKAEGCVWNKRQRVQMSDDNYMLLECAIDDVDVPIKKKFYAMDGDPGTSSLLEPTHKLTRKQRVKSVYDVLVVPLKYIFDLIPWDRFLYVDLVKTDCQGKDLDVVKSLGEYINKVACFNCEITTQGAYVGENTAHEFTKFFSGSGFEIRNKRGADINLVNKALRNEPVRWRCLGL
jgi:hypothetical protein